MAIQRAETLYPVNSTTVDSAAGIDIRLLDSAQAGATDSDQSVRFTHTQDGQERTFDPDNALVTTETDPLTFQGEGWALRLTDDMTPADDTNCNAILPAGTVTAQVRCLLNMNGGTNLGGATTITMRASLWKYNVSSNTGSIIASASQAQTWDTSALGGENNTRKNTSISIVVGAQQEFTANEVLMIQLGCEGTTLPNATLGTTNFDVTLDVDDSGTFVSFESTKALHQACALSSSLIGKGITTENGKQIAVGRDVTGKGSATFSKVVTAAKSFSLIGVGIVSHTKAVAEDFDLIGKGVPTISRAVIAAKSFSVVGVGVVPAAVLAVGVPRTLNGVGTVTSAKSTIVSKTFSLDGKGTITEVHPVQAFRTFNLVGKGEVLVSGPNGSSITVPLDELPTGEGGPSVTQIFGVLE